MNVLDFLKSVFDVALVLAIIRVSIPLIFASMGEMITEKSGMLNIGIEGIMLVGAFVAAIVAYFSGNAWWGLLAAVVVGALLGLIHSYLCITFHTDQALSGIAIFLLSSGLTGFLLQVIFEHGGNTPKVPTLPSVHMAFLEQYPVLDKLLNGHPLLVYIGFLTPFLFHFFVYRTKWGTWLRATGENPRALATTGINPIPIRYAATIFGAALASIGGAYLSISQVSYFVENMVAGRGFIALAAVIFGGTRPWGVFVAAMFFAVMGALQLTLQITISDAVIPRELFMALPYVFTVLVLAGIVKKSGSPADITNPYKKEAR